MKSLAPDSESWVTYIQFYLLKVYVNMLPYKYKYEYRYAKWERCMWKRRVNNYLKEEKGLWVAEFLLHRAGTNLTS